MSGPVTERGRVATAALAQSAPSQALAASAEVEMTPAPAAAQVLLYAATRSTLHPTWCSLRFSIHTGTSLSAVPPFLFLFQEARHHPRPCLTPTSFCLSPPPFC